MIHTFLFLHHFSFLISISLGANVTQYSKNSVCLMAFAYMRKTFFRMTEEQALIWKSNMALTTYLFWYNFKNQGVLQ